MRRVDRHLDGIVFAEQVHDKFIGSAMLQANNATAINRMEAVVTFNFPLKGRVLLSDRNRADLPGAIVTAEHDVLRDEGEAFARELMNAEDRDRRYAI